MAAPDRLISLSDLRRIRPWTERLGLKPGHLGAVWPPPGAEVRRARLYYHRHPELELNLVTQGSGTYLVGSRLVPIRRQSLLWLFPGQDHCQVRRSADLRFIIIVVRPDLLRSLAGSPAAVLAQDDPPGQWCRTLPLAEARGLQHLALELAGEEDAGMVNAGLAWLLQRCWRAFQAAQDVPAPQDLHPAVAEAARRLGDAQGGRTCSAAALAAGLGLSADHLGRLFRRQLGLSLPEYRNQRCLDRFLDLIEADPQANLLRAALDAGFGSYAQFHRVFRRAMGVSPQAWATAAPR